MFSCWLLFGVCLFALRISGFVMLLLLGLLFVFCLFGLVYRLFWWFEWCVDLNYLLLFWIAVEFVLVYFCCLVAAFC